MTSMEQENKKTEIPQRYRERIKNLRLLDDDFFSVCFADDLECTQLLLQILLGKADLKVTDVKTQYRMKNLWGREIILDAFATDSNEVWYNVEVQRKANGASPLRARYYSSMIDANLFPSGYDFGVLPESYVIFITENDALHGGLPIYHIDRRIQETNEAFGDKSHILYVNAAMTGDSALGRLMHDFNCVDPDKTHCLLLADKARHFKDDDKGAKEMCDFWEELKAEGRAEGLQEAKEKIEKAQTEARQAAAEARQAEAEKMQAKEMVRIKTNAVKTAFKMLLSGKLTVEEIADYTDLSLEEVQEFAALMAH